MAGDFMSEAYFSQYPNAEGFFGDFGGAFIPPELQPHIEKIAVEYQRVSRLPEFIEELAHIRKHFQGRPTPIHFAHNLTREIGGADIYLKREDLNHTGAHKLNHCMGEALLAKYLGKKKLIAETGAGQHGVALATAAAYFGMDCEIHMGEVDIEKEHPNVVRMKILGATVVPVSFGARTLKEAVDSAFAAYLEDPENILYAIGSVVGPHPFPLMVRDFQRVVGEEARAQIVELAGGLPDHVIACVGGGSNAMGIFSGFIDEPNVALYGVEPMGTSAKLGDNAATISLGKPGVIHGFKTLVIKDADGAPGPVHSIASGLDYPGIGPEHALLNELGRVSYQSATDQECLDAFYALSRKEGIIPALESAHAIAFAIKHAQGRKGETILVNLSGRGDKDIDYVSETFGFGED